MKIRKSQLKRLVEQIIREESQAAAQAKKMGLKHKGFGRYADKSGKVTHASRGGKLVKVGGGAKPSTTTAPVEPRAPEKVDKSSSIDKYYSGQSQKITDRKKDKIAKRFDQYLDLQGEDSPESSKDIEDVLSDMVSYSRNDDGSYSPHADVVDEIDAALEDAENGDRSTLDSIIKAIKGEEPKAQSTAPEKTSSGEKKVDKIMKGMGYGPKPSVIKNPEKFISGMSRYYDQGYGSSDAAGLKGQELDQAIGDDLDSIVASATSPGENPSWIEKIIPLNLIDDEVAYEKAKPELIKLIKTELFPEG